MSETTPLSAAQIADGRARLYWLLGQIAAGPLSAAMLPYLQTIAPLQVALDETAQLDAVQYEAAQNATAQHEAISFDRAQFGVRYEAVLGYQVLPYAGVFLDPDGMTGGALSDEILAFYRAAGYAELLHSGGSEHLANLLGCLAHLCAAENEAWLDDRQDIASQIRALQGDLLRRFLLPWLPPLAQALARAQDAFYAAFGALLVEAIADQWAEDGVYLPQTPPPAPPLPAPDLDTDGLRAIVAFLARPARAGTYLAPTELRRLGQQFGIAAGFGGRARQLETLLQSLPPHELPHLLAQLVTHITQWQAGYASLAQNYPRLQPWIDNWRARICTTHTLLQRMQQQAQLASL